MAIPCLVRVEGVGAVFYFLFQRSAVQRGNAVDAVVSIVDSKIRESSSFDLAVLTTVEGGAIQVQYGHFIIARHGTSPKRLLEVFEIRRVSISITYFVE